MAKSLKERQQEDGYWRPNLDDPNDYPYKETSGTGFFVYGLAWGINNGQLNEEEFKPVVVKGWKALNESVSEDGKVQWGQLGGGAPFVIKKEDTSEFVTGMFLLAASEVYKMH
jgi:rhamnogalacturonyl hydrolase YesR